MLEWKSCFLADAEGLHKGQCMHQYSCTLPPPPRKFPVAIDNTVHSCYKLWPRHCGDHGRYCSTATALSWEGQALFLHWLLHAHVHV